MKKREGFTLVEVMVVMAIISVLATLILGAIKIARNTAEETVHRSNAKTWQTYLEGKYAKYRRYCNPDIAVSPGEVRCGNASFQSLITASISDGSIAQGDIQITTVPTTGGCDGVKLDHGGAGNWVSGGGFIHVGTNDYLIRPYNYNCSDYVEKDELSTS